MINILFFMALFCLPMTSVRGLAFLGEIQHEVSAYFFLVLIGLFGARIAASLRPDRFMVHERVFGLPFIMAAMFSIIALSFVPNFVSIRDSFFLGRSGLEKFVSATILVVYGFGIAFLTYDYAAKRPWDDLIVRPLAWSVVACAVFSFFEMTMRWTGAMDGFFRVLSSPFYGDIPVLEWDERLRSFAFEPPDFANTAGYIWPWILGALLTTRGAMRWLFAGLFVVLNGMILLSGARTGFIFLGGLGLVFLALRLLFLPPHRLGRPEKMVAPATLVFAVFVPCVLILVAFFFDDLVFTVVAGENVSNLSRLASMTAALRMFAASPFYGFGFGQFGFHAADFMPSWGFYSPEIRDWLFGAIGAWPAVYSVYARFAADMGVLGVLFWLGLWLWLARAVLVETLWYRQRVGEVPFAAYPLILSCFAVLLAGVPCDSVRSPMIWINMGLACRYLATLRACAGRLSQ